MNNAEETYYSPEGGKYIFYHVEFLIFIYRSMQNE